jgi:hypothetical protein
MRQLGNPKMRQPSTMRQLGCGNSATRLRQLGCGNSATRQPEDAATLDHAATRQLGKAFNTAFIQLLSLPQPS